MTSRWTEADLRRLQQDQRRPPAKRTPARTLRAGFDHDEFGRMVAVWVEVPWRAKKLGRHGLGGSGWQAERGQTAKWVRWLGYAWQLLPPAVRTSAQLRATGFRRVVITRSHRSQPLDPDNADSVRKPIQDALVAFGWLKNDTRLLADVRVDQAPDPRPFTRVRVELTELVAGGQEP